MMSYDKIITGNENFNSKGDWNVQGFCVRPIITLKSDTTIEDLGLSFRTYNCLKRAGCDTIGEVLAYMDEDGQGLRRIRNLGSRSESEILEKIREYEKLCITQRVITCMLCLMYLINTMEVSPTLCSSSLVM